MAAEIHDPHPGGLARVVIVGAGFAGLAAVRELRDAPVRTLVIDQHNHHVFTPFLYQIASALLEPAEVAQPVRTVLRGVPNVDVRLGTVTAIDFDARRIGTDRGDLDYDYLVLAAGSVNNYYGNPKIAHHSLGLNDVGEALRLRNGILEALERAAWERDPDRRRRLLTFAVVGAGPT
ncbi:MAG: NAD(P)/FAD-dependent oxidoreductase, partial [Solirubrobacteraceae bacterium]